MGNGSVAIGQDAGGCYQNANSVAIGITAGGQSQGQNSVAIGHNAGQMSMSVQSVAIGFNAGSFNQASNCVAIGCAAGATGQAGASIAIGAYAGSTFAHSIVLNASGAYQGASIANACFINPVRNGGVSTNNVVGYDTTTTELYYTTKTFVIDHPDDPKKLLVHACLEGPESGVYYRGQGQVGNNGTTFVALPHYVRNLAGEFTVQLTPIFSGVGARCGVLHSSHVLPTADNGIGFTVFGDARAEFFWYAQGKRQNIDVEPSRSDVTVGGDGPYRYIH
jgi:hypothetical protein